MDITKSQSDFEAWWNAPEQAELRSMLAMGWGFRIWKASRESIEVKLPTQDEYDDPLSAYNAISDCKKILRTSGIRIKGGRHEYQ